MNNVQNRPNKNFGPLIGVSKKMKRIYNTIEKCASIDYPAMIYGETGTGKELIAREIHERSDRRDGPYVALNMSAIPKELVANELFGHEKGSYTGASGKYEGCFRQAEGGSLYFDEILTMDFNVQVSLLRVLETGKYRPVGGSRDYDVDVRIISSANVDPLESVRRNCFRSDLLHRLQVIRIDVPPLRERKSDIPVLANHFVEEFNKNNKTITKKLTDDAVEFLKEYSWPGNVRELRNAIFRAAVFAEETDILREHFMSILPNEEEDPFHMLHAHESLVSTNVNATDADHIPAYDNHPHARPTYGDLFLPIGLSIEEVQKAYILNTLRMTGNNKSKAAKILGVSRKTLYSRLEQWNYVDMKEGEEVV